MHRAVASESGLPLQRVRAEFRQQLSLVILRANARAASRRDPDGPMAAMRSRGPLSTQAAQALRVRMGLEGPNERDLDMQDASEDLSALSS